LDDGNDRDFGAGKHLGMFTDQVQVRARYAISDEPMSAEEWKKQFVREG
jgi:hypothetical protein